MSNEKDDKGFLSRWSERKVAVRESEQSEASEVPELRGPEENALPFEVTDAQQSPDGEPEFVPTEEDVKKLDINSDFSQFLKTTVPQHIKRMALQKLWRTDPAFGVVDGLLEYGEDYSDLHKKGAVIQSAYQAGKGYFSRDEEAPEDAVAATASDAADGDADDPVIKDETEIDVVDVATSVHDEGDCENDECGDGEDDFA